MCKLNSMTSCVAILAAFSSLPVQPLRAQGTATLDVDLSKRGPAIPPTFGGLMTEEINHSYDGGLYAELIQNRTFQDPAPRQRQPSQANLPVHWSVIGDGKATIDRSEPVNSALPLSLRLDLPGGTAGVANDGYWGIPLRPGTKYTASFYARGGAGFAGPVTASLLTDDGSATVAKAVTRPISAGWQKYTVSLTTDRMAPTTAKARFVLSATGSGSVSFSLVSLFPPTFRNTPGGLRPDLMKLMADLHPAFIRLPGGNYVEGSTFATRFNWKQMIGPASLRPGHMGCWGYRSSDGFGMPEYLLWCKQLNAEPVLAVFAGYVLNRDHVDAGSPEMGQYTQEALEEIEYVSGPATSEWGKRRAADGFPEPFPLHYVEIGNEDWFDRSGSYDGRFTQMAKAIHAKYPHIKIIATAPVTSFRPDLVDDHFYRSARQLMIQGRQYNAPAGSAPLRFAGGAFNGRQPNGIQTFVGEWAAQEGRPTPNLNAALADAAFIMSLEQNADAVPLECYAPLLVNVNPADPEKGYPRAAQWGTNLIGYDALHSFGSPSYYAQSMLAMNRGDVALESTLNAASTATAAAPAQRGRMGVGTWHTQVEYTDITVTTPDGQPLRTAVPEKSLAGWDTTGGRWDGGNGTIAPAGGDSESWAMTGDPNWTDYVIRLRARKQAGREGFIVLFHAKDGSNYRWWNVGGWGNTLARCEVAENGDRAPYGTGAPFAVETGRWYDLRLEVTGSHVRGFVDGKLVTDTNEQPAAASLPVTASATYSTTDNKVIIKVVNPGGVPIDMAIHLRGGGKTAFRETAISLAGDPNAVNTIEQPMNVAPKEEAVANVSESFHRTFPPHSLTLLRLTETLVATGASARNDGLPTLKDAYKRHFHIGVAINRSIATGSAGGGRPAELVNKDIALTKDQFNQISPENDLKWESIHPREGADGYNFGPADAYVDFGIKNHMLIVGHTLVWHGQTPRWVFAGTTPPANAATPPAQTPPPADGAGANPGRRRFGGGFGGFNINGPHATRDELLARMREHIHTVVGRYKGKIKVWDVVNEAISDGGPDVLRTSPWQQIIGPDFIAKAFEYAHEADPGAILRYNDYGLENPAKRQKLIALIKQLQAQKVPVMAIGSQTHVSATSPGFEEEDRALTEMEVLGLPIHITELDVNGAQGGQRSNGADVANNAATTQGGLVDDANQRLANQYYNLFTAFRKHKSVKVVTMWGVNDGVSWRANGKPLLFDTDDKPKPAFDAVIRASKGNKAASK